MNKDNYCISAFQSASKTSMVLLEYKCVTQKQLIFAKLFLFQYLKVKSRANYITSYVGL